VKKETLKRQLAEAYEQLDAARAAVGAMTSLDFANERRIRELTAELEAIKTNWRPVPMTHEWQPKNPQCALCDEQRDAARHRVEGSPA
jgi:hypothetical protein